MLFQKIQTVAPLSEEDWALFLGISTKTLQRNKTTQNFQFKPIHSEKIFEMAEVMLLGVSVFENKDNFYQWLGLSNTSLGGKTPIELVSNSYGKELVMDCLHRIEHGIFA